MARANKIREGKQTLAGFRFKDMRCLWRQNQKHPSSEVLLPLLPVERVGRWVAALLSLDPSVFRMLGGGRIDHLPSLHRPPFLSTRSSARLTCRWLVRVWRLSHTKHWGMPYCEHQVIANEYDHFNRRTARVDALNQQPADELARAVCALTRNAVCHFQFS